MHALIIGGTGMLRGVMEHYRKSCKVVSILARSQKDLEKLEKRYPGIIRGIAVDYLDQAVLQQALKDSIEKHGRYDLVIAWMQDAPIAVVQTIATFVGTSEDKGTFVRVRGSEAADPASPAQDIKDVPIPRETLDYQEVILGFVISGAESRWLNHIEITEGIIEAIDTKQPKTIIGVVEPWAKRPKNVRK